MKRYTWLVVTLVVMGGFGAGILCGTQWNNLSRDTRKADAERTAKISPCQQTLEYSRRAAPQLENKADPPAATPSTSKMREKRQPALETVRATDKMPFSPPPGKFNLFKLGTGEGPTLLVIGGIQGDEPGGFSAASLIASHYSITAGSVWVVPDLNFQSILQRNRGLTGDMNRKFASITIDDPDYDLIMQIKSVLLDAEVDLILNLHDGSGFYRPVWENDLRNPKRWGQSLIIDQAEIDSPHFNQLYLLAGKVEAEVNRKLLDKNHRYHIYNTYTSYGNEEMAKTLSYFAICNKKPAFGIEASKEFTTEYRSYYHLQVIESFMRQIGISFSRDFELTPTGVLAALNSNLKVAAYDSKLILDLENARPTINMVPFKKGTQPDVKATKPLLAIVPDSANTKNWRVAYGNRTLTRLNPDFMDFDDSIDSVQMRLDGTPRTVRLGEIVSVKNSFLMYAESGYRVNAIGAQKEKDGSEANVTLKLADFLPRFSVDKGARSYRVEIYKEKSFVGMVLVHFGDSAATEEESLMATHGPERKR